MGANFKLLGTATPSGASDVDLDLLDDTYRIYKLVADNLSPGTDGANFRYQFRVASVDQSGASDYSNIVGQILLGAWSIADNDALSFLRICNPDTGSATGEGISAFHWLFRPHDADEGFTTIFGQSNGERSADGFTYPAIGGGFLRTSGANVNGIRVHFSSGTFSGRIRLYGLVGS